ncbi:hypothetical protein [Streptomyces sp. NPDC088360]|uniref:hypothetical protein n=1 Tax=Streptomyces sp. NPDC088360 TaxID=3154515 RepID=UPI00344CD467
MARRTLPTVTALVTSAALLLTACGGGGGDDSSDRIEGAGKGSGKPSPTASESSDVDRPKITLPTSFKADFEGWTDSDPKIQSILNDGKERLRGTYAAIGEADPEADYLAFYSARSALASGEKWVRGYEGLTITGEIKAFSPEAEIREKGRATLFYCVDESKGFSKDLKTGKKEGTPEGESPKVQYRTALEKSDNGVWMTTSVETAPGGC